MKGTQEHKAFIQTWKRARVDDQQAHVAQWHALASFHQHQMAPPALRLPVGLYLQNWLQLDGFQKHAELLLHSMPNAPDDDTDEDAKFNVEAHVRLSNRVQVLISESKEFLRQSHWSLNLQATRMGMSLPDDLQDMVPKWTMQSILHRLKGLGGSSKGKKANMAELDALRAQLKALKEGHWPQPWVVEDGNPCWKQWTNTIASIKGEVDKMIEARAIRVLQPRPMVGCSGCWCRS